ncbi:protein FAR1-RELATED SEQUENCE 5-like [Helianthus annuus]|uniref:protein FAR1-RELATED SEQUENCE 5-like n=1 Tax=Helianthus annuus TaxID=4232 RepID=UPI001652FC59|nr:protein FAR1-RELATED SEQUENCE 5-like [Helianthus annuus]
MNYEAFGDVLAFDATYHANMYDMIFVPFTGVDHHKKCMIFGAGLLHNETIESYTWLLQKFVQAHNGRQPLLVLTDQDCAMKQAVSNIFDKSHHRLCMWHIVQKIPSKIKGDNLTNIEIKEKFHKIVWNVYIKPETFEKRWNSLIAEYGLESHQWLTEMFSIREQWIPGYFREIPMCTLMETTSRCESVNHMFEADSSAHNTLVQFMLCYDTSIDGLRNKQRELCNHTETTNPEKYKTSYMIERHANVVYTRKIFYEVQKEIFKGTECSYIVERSLVDGVHCFTVAHLDHEKEVVNEFKLCLFSVYFYCTPVFITSSSHTNQLLNHLFIRSHNIQEILARYIHPRWRRNALPSVVHSTENMLSVDQSRHAVLWRRILDNMDMCRDRVWCNIDKLEELDSHIQALKDKIFPDVPYDVEINKKGVAIQEIIAHTEPDEISCTTPKKIRNKGCGKHKRPIGPREKAIKVVKKSRTKCNYCKKRVRKHDKRNCPLKKGKPTKDDSSTDEDDEEDEDEEDMEIESDKTDRDDNASDF